MVMSKKMPPPNFKSKGSAYFFFFQDYLKDDTSKNCVDANKKCSEAWANLSKRERNKYILMEKADAKRAAFEKKSYDSQLKQQNVKKPKLTRPASTMYYHSVKEELRKENPDLGFHALRRMAISQYKELSEEEKIPFEEQSKADRKRFLSEKREIRKPPKMIVQRLID